MILNAIAKKLKRQSKDDFKGRHFEAWLIVQAVTWYLRSTLSYRDLEEMFCERGFEVDHSTINRWVLAYAPMIEKRLRQFRRPHCWSGGPCNTEAAQGLVDQPKPTDEAAMQLTGAKTVRQIAPSDMVTQDFRDDRVTIETDPASGMVTQATCG
jgi:hypothetical protein